MRFAKTLAAAKELEELYETRCEDVYAGFSTIFSEPAGKDSPEDGVDPRRTGGEAGMEAELKLGLQAEAGATGSGSLPFSKKTGSKLAFRGTRRLT